MSADLEDDDAPGFVFNIKAFGLLAQHPIDPRRLPDVIRERLPRDVLDKGRLYHSAVLADIRELVWTMHIEALRPLAEAGKLGCMLFQFPPWFRRIQLSGADGRLIGLETKMSERSTFHPPRFFAGSAVPSLRWLRCKDRDEANVAHS